ncbi:MAG TPA: ATP synthase F1 subunit gamma [Bryobacteraceae bacterium]|nr:ATP synthase F1 subunit gamma [Bryobacteraceae bacterium]
MPSLIDIRRRIRSVRNTQQITKALKMISAAKLRKAQDRALAARPYATILQQMLANVAQAAGDSAENPLLAVRPENRILLIVITADMGKAGGFNANLIRMAQRFVDEHRSNQLTLDLVGKKGRDYFRKRGVRIHAEYVDIFRVVRYETADQIADAVLDLFAKADIDAVYLFGNEFKSVMSSHLVGKRLLPIEIPQAAAPVDYIYEQPPAELLGSLLPRYVKAQIYRALLESSAAEHAARMTAMDAASSNASDMIDSLTLYLNRVRQASITKEIIEVVSGAAALE